VLVTFAADFPALAIGPQSRMTRLRLTKNRQWLNFAPEEFRQQFNIDAASNEVARAVLADEMIGWLMAGRMDVRFTLAGGALLGHVPVLGQEDPEWDPFLEYVIGFHSQIPAQAWADFSLFGSLG
jgi:hypothetical protein